MATPYPSVALSQTSTFMYDQKVFESRFGDGYSQRASAGLNDKPLKAQLVHENINQATLNTLITFWNTQGRVTPFDITNPLTGLTVRMRFIEPLNISAMAGDVYTVRTSAEQDFSLN